MKKDLLTKEADKAAENIAFQIDRYVKLHIAPKPWYLPRWLWFRILERLLVLKEFSL